MLWSHLCLDAVHVLNFLFPVDTFTLKILLYLQICSIYGTAMSMYLSRLNVALVHFIYFNIESTEPKHKNTKPDFMLHCTKSICGTGYCE